MITVLWLVAGLLSAMYLYAGILKAFQDEKAKADAAHGSRRCRHHCCYDSCDRIPYKAPRIRGSCVHARACRPRGVRGVRAVATRALLRCARGTVDEVRTRTPDVLVLQAAVRELYKSRG